VPLQEKFVDTDNVDLVFLEYSLNDGYVVRPAAFCGHIVAMRGLWGCICNSLEHVLIAHNLLDISVDLQRLHRLTNSSPHLEAVVGAAWCRTPL
jgi:hypothetical protein